MPISAANFTVLGALLGALVGATACDSTPTTATPESSTGESTTSGGTGGVGTSGLSAAERLDATMVIGPSAARELGYRIAWETDRLTSPGGVLAQAVQAGDAIFTLDSRNLLARVRPDDGIRIWTSPVGAAADRTFGINRLQLGDTDRLYLTTESNIWLIESSTGVPAGRHSLARSANTASVFAAGRLVYGTRAGQIVWLDPLLGHPWRVRELDGPIRSAPILASGELSVVSGGGNVMVLDAARADVMWRKELLAGVVAAPTGDRGVIFVAGLDQYLWAFDQRSGRTLWKHFNDAPLTTAPVLLDDRLFQRLANVGLVCFDAFPGEAPDGRRIWVNENVRGDVIGRKGRSILVWDASARVLSALDAARGGVVNSVTLPNVDGLVLTKANDGDLLAFNRDGRLVRLVPQ